MSLLKILRAVNYPRMPWKNGGGSTEEITRDGSGGAALDGFGWRLSIADIAESGGFSRFAGYQRIITVLQGDGMVLRVDGRDSRALQPFDAFAFEGDSEVCCELLQIEQGEPCLLIRRRTWSGRTPVTAARLIHPGSRHRLEGRFSK